MSVSILVIDYLKFDALSLPVTDTASVLLALPPYHLIAALADPLVDLAFIICECVVGASPEGTL